MSDALTLHLLRRNAILRAWATHGVPVNARWNTEVDDFRDSPSRGALCAWLRLRCTVCDREWKTGRLGFRVEKDPQELVNAEQMLAGRAVQRNCPHLSPLRSPPSEEVLAIADLELLAGNL